MKLYASVTSERATKGQGGNNRLDTIVTDSKKREVVRLLIQINEDGTATLRYWDATMSGEGFTARLKLDDTKGEKQEDKTMHCGAATCGMSVPVDEQDNCTICGARCVLQ